jgi:ankyrin repeat protein
LLLTGELLVLFEVLDLGADTEIAYRKYRWTTLMRAARGGRAEVVKRLLRGGARVNAQDWNGATAAYLAVKGNHVEIIGMAIAAGADPNLFGTTLGSPLCAAVVRGAIDAVKSLSWKGSDIDIEGRCTAMSFTALHAAASANNTGIGRVLVEGVRISMPWMGWEGGRITWRLRTETLRCCGT